MSPWYRDYLDGTVPHTFIRFMRLWTDDGQRWVAFEITDDASEIHLGLILSHEPGSGAGSAALNWLTRLADAHDLPITGQVVRMGQEGLTVRALHAWYRRHGFTVSRYGKLTYTPRQQEAAA